MKQFFLVGIFTILSVISMQAQTSNKVEDLKSIAPTTQIINPIQTKSVEVAAKKKDILTDKIESKLNGKINLFVLKETRLVC